MKLSNLQKYILKESFGLKDKLLPSRYHKYYNGQKSPSKSEQVKILSKSIDRLINKGLLIGYGKKTQDKWFIQELELTKKGSCLAKKLLGEQTSLPLKKKLKK